MNEEGEKNVGYYILYGVAYLHALLPFSILYVLSDIMYIAVYHIFRYRRTLVRKNLTHSFPEKAEKEITKTEKVFYRHLCDYFVETIKTIRLSDKEVMKRMKFANPEVINYLTKDGNSCIVSLGHYGNWEWVPSISMYLRPGVEQGLIYKRLHSRAFDTFFLHVRSRFSPKPIEMKNAFRNMVKLRNEGKTMAIGFLTDQRPPRYHDQYWTTFLNQDTLVQTGMERIARQMKFSVAYLDITKVKRGYYVGRFSVIAPDASQEQEFAITETYMRKLEKTILQEPAYYLWSHNRWKFKKKTDENTIPE